jgi:acyl phosphate:glycerol-3-phosphate acyltransferase
MGSDQLGLWAMPALILAGSYLLGSIPFGLLVARILGKADPRGAGSGNIGATNLLRTAGRTAGALTLLLDGGKGALAVAIGSGLHPDGGALAGIGAFFGHVFPVWLRFHGGKGVATLLGVALALHWPTGLVAAGIWLLMLAVSRHSSVGGMSAAIATPVAASFFFRADLTLTFLAMALVVLWRHRGNIERLLQGTEPRIGTRAR